MRLNSARVRLGALLAFTAFGPGRFSIDKR